MAEEITNYKAPIATIPVSQLVFAELNALRQQRKRLRKDESIKENERLQASVESRLRAMGRDDLINYHY